MGTISSFDTMLDFTSFKNPFISFIVKSPLSTKKITEEPNTALP
jgi:hypothetical protein